MSKINKNVLKSLSKIDKKLPHGSNLATKIKTSIKNCKNELTLQGIATNYIKLQEKISLCSTADELNWISKSLTYFEKYYSYLKKDENKKFSHQSDFLSSLLPEFLYLLYKTFIIPKHPDLELSTQKNIIIDISFLPYDDVHATFKQKRVDVAITKDLQMEISGNKTSFNAPVVAVEVKTNLDKNMISGVEYSVERLKQTFPLCMFFLVSELADFAYKKQNYAGTSINEILILRKQKRSIVRKDSRLIENIDKNLMLAHLTEVSNYLDLHKTSPNSLKKRMSKGKLINEL